MVRIFYTIRRSLQSVGMRDLEFGEILAGSDNCHRATQVVATEHTVFGQQHEKVRCKRRQADRGTQACRVVLKRAAPGSVAV